MPPALQGAFRTGAPFAWGVALTGASAVLLVWVLFFGGGSGTDGLVFAGASTILVAALALGAYLLALAPLPLPSAAGLAFLGLLAAFAAWSGLSILWSIQGDRTWDYTNRGLVYVAFALLGLFVGGYLARAPRRIAAALAVLLACVLAWALAGKVFPGLFPDGARAARLRNPIGYWNALALLGDVGLVLGLWIASRRDHPRAARSAGVLLVYAAVVAVLLTYSRAGVVVGALAVAAWLALDRARLESLAALLAGAPLGAAVAAVATALPGVTDDRQAHSVRVEHGAYFGLVLVAGAALAWAAARALLALEEREPLPPERRHALVRRTLIGFAAAGVVALCVLVVRAGGPGPFVDARVDEFSEAQLQPTTGPSRIGSFSSGNRWTWWKEAWHAFREDPLDGTGAGSFELAHRFYRTRFSPPVTEPHNVPLQFLSETGLVGFALAGGAALAAALAIVSVVRGPGEADRAAAIALSVGALAYGLHALVDFDWDYVAVTGPLFFVVGALIGTRSRLVRLRAPEPLWAAGAAGVAVAAVFSIGSPWLAERNVDDALAAFQRGDLKSTADAADDAHALNPLALEPLLVGANAAAATHDIPRAKRLFEDAISLQPKNADAWYEYGAFELDVDRFPRLAYEYLNRSYTLDRFGPASGKGGKLDQARKLVNAAAKRQARARGARP